MPRGLARITHKRFSQEAVLAVKILRQPKKIALIGAPTSAAALRAGHERAPAALRDAGLVARLESAGFEVTDLGDTVKKTFQVDDEHPRARNVGALVEVLNDLRPRVEQAIKSGALPLIIGGDCSIALATIAGARRYYRQVNLIYVDADADLNVPATTPSGCVDGMVVSHIVGRGAPELVRFWGEPPLVREADIVLFGYDRLDAPEEAALAKSPIRRFSSSDVKRMGAGAAARAAIKQLHSGQFEYILHFDVDAISGGEFSATNFSGSGLGLEPVREALNVFAREKSLAVFEVTTYNPELDSDGSGARMLIDLLAEVLTSRLQEAAEEEAKVQAASAASAVSQAAAPAASISASSEISAAPATVHVSEPVVPVSDSIDETADAQASHATEASPAAGETENIEQRHAGDDDSDDTDESSE
jgi:arginase